MEKKENQPDTQLENEQTRKLSNRAIDQLAIGSVIVLWGILLTLKQVAIIDKNVNTWPFALTAFGILLVAGGICRLSRSRHL
jgi:amino acid transporter